MATAAVQPLPDVYSRRNSTLSSSTEKTNTTWRYDVFGHPRIPKGAMVYTGPDNLSEFHRMTVDAEHRYVGIGTFSKEHTSELDYLWRPAPRATFPRPKSVSPGAIGWGVTMGIHDRRAATTGAQIVLGPFRQEVEQRATHRFQNAWYPGPNEHFVDNSGYGRVLNVYQSRAQSAPVPPTEARINSFNRRTPSATALHSVGASGGQRSRTNSISSHSSRHTGSSLRSGSTTIKYT